MWGHIGLDRKIRLTSMVSYRKYQLRYIIALWSQQWKMCVSSRLLLKKHLISFLGLKEMSSKSPCLSSCNDCLAIKSVCANCMVRGLTSHIPSLRACNTCLAEGLKCNRFLVMAVVTGCEECNKKATEFQCKEWDLACRTVCQMMFTLGRVLSAAGPTGSLTLKAQEVTSYTPCVILEALIFTENLGNALPSLVCETKIAWQSNQSCALPDQQS